MPDTNDIRSPKITDPQLLKTAKAFRRSADDLFNAAQDDDRKRKVVQQLFAAMKNFTREFTALIPDADNGGCPEGWVSCPGGSCVPQGAGCGESWNFEAQGLTIAAARERLNTWIDDAASVYFAAARDDKMRQQTRALLAKAKRQFTASINS